MPIGVLLDHNFTGRPREAQGDGDDVPVVVTREKDEDAVPIMPVPVRPGFDSGGLGEGDLGAVGSAHAAAEPIGLPCVLSLLLPSFRRRPHNVGIGELVDGANKDAHALHDHPDAQTKRVGDPDGT